MNPQELSIYNDFMADTSSETDSDVQPPRPRKMIPVSGKTYESDSSVEILKNEDIEKFERR